MKQLLKYYKPLLTTLLIGLVIFGIEASAYANDQCVQGTVTDINYVTSALTHLMSWAWSIPAIVAGELMSNDLIYGQIVGLEHYFYQFWTLMKTIANFAIIAIVVIMIGKSITKGGDEIQKMIREQGWKILISGILINASRFLMGAMIDVSTVMIAGVGQIANVFITQTVAGGNTQDLKWLDQIAGGIPAKITVDKCGCIKKEAQTADPSRNWSNLVTKRNTISGPLIFLGAGIMKLQVYTMDVGCGSETIGNLGKATVKTIVQMLLMIMFITPLVVLAAYNLFRLIYIWGWIVFSPLIILYNLLGDAIGLKAGSGLQNAISVKNIIFGLLQPVLTVGALSVGVMLISGLYQAVDYTNTKSLDEIGVAGSFTNGQNGSSLNIGNDGKLGSMTLIDKIIEDPSGTVGGGFGYLLIAFTTCFVMWMLVKMSFSISTETFSAMGFNPQELMESIWKFAKVKTPTPLMGGASLGETMKFLDPNTNQVLEGLVKEQGKYTDKLGEGARDNLFKSPIGKVFGLDKLSDLNSDQEQAIKGVGNIAGILEDASKEFKDSNFNKQKERNNYTNLLFKNINDASNESKGKNFTIRTGTKTYSALKDWYDKGGNKIIKINSEEKAWEALNGRDNKKYKSFDDIYNGGSTVLGSFIENMIRGGKTLKKEGIKFSDGQDPLKESDAKDLKKINLY